MKSINCRYPVSKPWMKVLREVTEGTGRKCLLAGEIGVTPTTVYLWLNGQKGWGLRKGIQGIGYVNFCILHEAELRKAKWKDPRPRNTLERFGKTIAEMARIYRATGQMCEEHILNRRSTHGSCRSVMAVCQTCGNPLDCGLVVKGKMLMVGVKPCVTCKKARA